MKFEQRMKYYAGAAGVLVVLVLVGIFWGPQARTQGGAKTPLLPGFSQDRVALIKTGGFELRRTDNLWTVALGGEEFPGETDKVTALLKTLSELKVERTVSQTGADGDKYGFTAGTTVVVLQDKDKNDLAALEIGSSLDNGRQVYVRSGTSPVILVTDRLLSNQLYQDFNQWTDLKVLSGVDEKKISQVSWKGSVTFGDQNIDSFTWTLTPKDGQDAWVRQPEGGDPSSLPGKISQLNSTRAQENGRSSDAAVFENLNLGVVTVSYGTENLSLQVGAPNDRGLYPVQVNKRRLWLSEWALKDLLLQ